MKRHSIILIGVLNCILLFRSQAQEPTNLIDTFFVKLERIDSDTALDYLFSTNEWIVAV